MAELQEYKCPCCDGAIAFDAQSQKLACPYCGTEFEIETLASYDSEVKGDTESDMHWESDAGTEWREGETEGLRVYTCNSCGGEIVTDETTAATKCPYCENPVVMTGQLAGDLRPDYIIPFKVDKAAAKRALLEHYKGKRLMPKIFADENHLDEIKGVYVPFWVFDTDADANIRYRATRVRHWSDSRYNYTETSYYNITRQGSLGFEKVPVDGSTKVADDLMESIEPFDFSEALSFEKAYLAGFLADKYDVSSEQSIERANSRIKKSTEDTFASTVSGYTSVIPTASSVSFRNSNAKYALYPVWLLNTTWEGQKFTFAMNGQTGKFVGNLPLDKSAYRKWLFGITGAVGAIGFVLFYRLWLL